MSVHSPGTRLNHHDKLFAGDVYYVDAAMADNTGSGLSPEAAKKTIQAAIDAAAIGDAVTIKSGAYAEDVTVNKNYLELWFELGSQITGQTNDYAVTVTSNYCRLICEHGALKVTPAAGKSGIQVTGNFCYLNEIRVACGSSGLIGFDIGSADGDSVDGGGADLRQCRCASPLTAAFKIQADKVKLDYCCTGGEPADTSIGFWITNSCDKPRLHDCHGQGHATAGFQVDAGCANGDIINCSSGGGDGARIDNGTDIFWPNFQDTLRRDNHVQIYPFPDGEGTAGSPIAITTDADDKTNGAASTADYFGEPFVLVAPEIFTSRWDYVGNNIYCTTTNKAFRGSVYRIVNEFRAVRDAGNAWDEGATVLTFDDAADFVAGDLIWISSSAHKPNGEVVRITDVTGAVVTIEREASQFGGANTGLRWDHSTNVGAGTLYAYLCWRDESQYHASGFDYAAPNSKWFGAYPFPKPRGMNANSGLIVRLQNSTDGTNGAGLDMTICYKD